MVEITILELSFEGSSFSGQLPLGEGADETAVETEDGDEDDSRTLAIAAVLLVLVLGAALVRYLSDDDEPEVAIETADEPAEVEIE